MFARVVSKFMSRASNFDRNENAESKSCCAFLARLSEIASWALSNRKFYTA